MSKLGLAQFSGSQVIIVNSFFIAIYYDKLVFSKPSRVKIVIGLYSLTEVLRISSILKDRLYLIFNSQIH